MGIKKNDFVEIDYTGISKDENAVFDTTLKEVAVKNELYHEEHAYKPVILCVGQNQILKAVDESLIGKSVGESFTLDLKSEDAFGKKNSELIQFIPISNFRQSQINPVPGLHVNIDGIFGIVRTVSGGRTLVDFNHPLSGKDIKYEISIKRIVGDKQEKLKSLLSNVIGDEAEILMKDSEASVNVPKGIELDDENQKEIQEKVKELIPEITTLKFNQSTGKK